MKNFVDIPAINSYSLIAGDLGNFSNDNITIEYNLDNISIPSKSLIVGAKTIFCGFNITINDIGELNYSFNTKLDTNQLSGDFSNLSIKDKSLTLGKLQNINSNKLFSSNGEISLGENLSLSGNKLINSSGEVNISPGLEHSINPSTISTDGIYFLDNNSFNTVIVNPLVNRAYIINKSTNIIYLGEIGNLIPVYPGEICLFSSGKKIKTNYIGDYDFDEPIITEQLNTEYDNSDIFVTLVDIGGTNGNPILTLYSPNENLDFKLVGPANQDLNPNLNYSVTKIPDTKFYTIEFIRGESTNNLQFGTWNELGLSEQGGGPNTKDGIYKIYAKDSSFNHWKLVYTHEIKTRKAILVPDIYNIVLNQKNTIFDLKLLEDQILSGNTYWNTTTAINLGSAGTVSLSPNGNKLYINLVKTNILVNTNGRYYVTLFTYQGSVSDTVDIFIIVPTKIPELPNPFYILNDQVTSINIFNYFEFWGENLFVSSGTRVNSVIDGFGTVSLNSSGDLSLSPEEFSTGSYSLVFQVKDKLEITYDIELNIQFRNPGFNTSSMWRVDVMGAFSDIVFIEDSERETQLLRVGDTRLIETNRLDSFSTGNEAIKPFKNIDIYDYFFNSDNELTYYALQEALDTYRVASKKTYESLEGVDYNCAGENGCYPVSSYSFKFDQIINLKDLYIIPAKNKKGYILEPKQYAVFKSLDNGNSWILYKSSLINTTTNDNSWNKYLWYKFKELEVKYSLTFNIND